MVAIHCATRLQVAIIGSILLYPVVLQWPGYLQFFLNSDVLSYGHELCVTKLDIFAHQE